ncbi:hypothetical protein WMY93_003896 [Mugilogobius chulae]|uniref:Uncharacterized protein n=1 Tax=Mugilogobius chulae TaxID=88201 RepID=A0AAW0PYW4_9GOBI
MPHPTPLVYDYNDLVPAFSTSFAFILPSYCILSLKALGTHNRSATIDLSSMKSGIFSGRLAAPASLRKYPDGPVLSSSQAKALLTSLSSSGLTAEALLLSSTLRQHRNLREQRASSLGLSSSSSPPSSSPSPTSATPSLSPSSPTSLSLSSSMDHKPSSRLDRFDFSGRSGKEAVTKDLDPKAKEVECG